MRKNIFVILLVVFALIFGRMLITKMDKNKNAKQLASMRVPSVTIAEVQTQNLRRQFSANARVVSKYRVDILARINGYLTKSYFDEGDNVKAGQVLFEIEPQQYTYAANQAKANYENAKSQYEYYQKQLARYQELVKQDYVARADYDSILSQRDAFKAQMASAESAYRDAQRNLGYTKVKAPIDGRIGLISVTEGNYVSMNSGPLTTINSSNPIYVQFSLDSKIYKELVRIDKSADVKREVEFEYNTGRKYELKGSQDFYDNKIDESTGTITLRATFPNPNNELIQGEFGRITIFSNLKDDIPVVPQVATMENQEGLYVYKLDENNLPRMTYIKTMGQDGDNWIVIDGLGAGDKVLTSGLQKVIPGNPVKIVEKAVEQEKSQEKTGLINSLKNMFKNK